MSIITVGHMGSKLLSHGSKDVFLLTLLKRAARSLNVLTLLWPLRELRAQLGLLRVIFYVVSMSGSRTRFSKCSVSGSSYFVDVESIQIEKNELSCGMFL